MGRRTQCPDGRPLHRNDDFPEGMATRTMLARQRRRLAEDQAPVATYWTGMDYVPLYAVAASVALPPMTAKQQARWDAFRTCERCGFYNETPLNVGRDGRRLDEKCYQLQEFARLAPSHLALRVAASQWARDVLAHPNSVVIAADVICGHAQGSPLDVHARTIGGEELVDVLVWPSPLRNLHGPNGLLSIRERSVVLRDRRQLMRPPYAIGDGRVVERLYPLVGMRLIHMVMGGWNNDMVSTMGLLSDPGTFAWSQYEYEGGLLAGGAVVQDRKDCFSRRWDHWLCRRSPGVRYPGEQGLQNERLTAEWASQMTTRMIEMLRRMADDEHPDGPAVCPVLPATGTEPCGARDMTLRGVCARHEETDGYPR